MMLMVKSQNSKIIGLMFLSLVFVFYAKAQLVIDENNKPSFNFQWDNDVLFYTDYYYSQGISLKLNSPFLKKNPVNYILLKLPNSKSSYSLSLVQQVFTPLEIRDSIIRIDDRPYAGLLYLRSERLSVNSKIKMLLRSSLDLGMRGPYSFARQTQYYYHKIGSIVLPQGWKYQMTSFPMVNYNVAARKSVYSFSKYDDISALSEIRLGTIYDDISLGGQIKLGLFDDIFEEERSDLEFFATINASIKYVVYNGTMQGSLNNNPNPYEFYSPDIKDLVYSYSAVASLRYKKFGLDFSWFYLSPEFSTGRAHRYNSLNLKYYW